MEYLGHSNIITSDDYLKVASPSRIPSKLSNKSVKKIALGCVAALEVKIQTFGMAERNGGCILGCGFHSSEKQVYFLLVII